MRRENLAKFDQVAMVASLTLVLVTLWLRSYPWTAILLTGAIAAGYRLWRHTRAGAGGSGTDDSR